MCFKKRNEILANLETYHAKYYETGPFRGPSLYYHLQALKSGRRLDEFAEASYAMLVSWGMHRMGPKGAKMKYFDDYKASLASVWPMVMDAAQFVPAELDDNKWTHLKQIFCGLDVMATRTSLVGNSKVMAHALPHLIAPIDRHYTLSYLYGRGNIQNSKDKEWELLKNLMTDFFFPITVEGRFSEKVDEWKSSDFAWDTSPLKIVDNLIIGAEAVRKNGQIPSNGSPKSRSAINV